MADLERVRARAEAMLRLHLDDSWTFAYDHAKRRAGACDFTKRRITLSRFLTALHEEHDVTQTLLHEIAHALAGHAAGHGPAWQRIARQIGYEGGTTHRLPIASEQARWIGTCPNGHEFLRFRRPARRMTSCARCSRTFDPTYEITWRERPTV